MKQQQQIVLQMKKIKLAFMLILVATLSVFSKSNRETSKESKSLAMMSIPKLNSKLNFGGASFQNTDVNTLLRINNIIAPASGHTPQQIEEIWNQVSEDYSIFNINITTDPVVYNKAPANRRVRCVFTTSGVNIPNFFDIGYAVINGYKRSSTTTTNAISIVIYNPSRTDIASLSAIHEIGHNFGLQHTGLTASSPLGKSIYFDGHGNYKTIMGRSGGYYLSSNQRIPRIIQWSKGEYQYADNKTNSIGAILSNPGVTLKADDHGNNFGSATKINSSNKAKNGIITTRNDKDVFSFTTNGGKIEAYAAGPKNHGNLNIKMTLFNSSGKVIKSDSPTGLKLDAFISARVAKGTYFIEIDGVGEGNPLTNGFSDYGSLGQYSLNVTFPKLQGSTGNNGGANASIANGNYFIQNPAANVRINSPSGRVINKTFTANNSAKWQITKVGNYYTIKNSRNNEFLEVPYAVCNKNQNPNNNNINLGTWKTAGSSHQQWDITKVGANYFLKPLHCNKVIDRNSNSAMHLWPYQAGNPNQSWRIIPASGNNTNTGGRTNTGGNASTGSAPVGKIIGISPVKVSWVNRTGKSPLGFLSARLNEAQAPVKSTAITTAPNEAWKTWERFVVETHPRGGIALKVNANGGRYLQHNGAGNLSATARNKNVDATKFIWEKLSGTKNFALRTPGGRYMQTPQNAATPVINTSVTKRGAWEIFTYVELASAKVLSEASNKISIVKNPITDGVVYLKGASNSATYILSNISGQAKGIGEIIDSSIDVSEQSKGVYILSIFDEGKTQIEKIVIN